MAKAKTAIVKANTEEHIRARNEKMMLKAAVELFSRKGFDGTRIAEIAQVSGLPKANVYYYFATKQAIYTRLIESLLAGWDKALEHISADREPREALAAYVAAKLEYSRKHTSESRLFANEMLGGGQFISRQQKQHVRAITRERAAVIQGWIKKGKLAPVDPNHFLIMLWATTQFYADFASVTAVTLGKGRLNGADFEEARKTIVEVVLNGAIAPMEPAKNSQRSLKIR